MCGVIGYVGIETNLGEILLAGLRTLEYRGYDSWGVGIAGPDALIVEKHVGRVPPEHAISQVSGSLGFGHTRWATHGGVEERNAHPQVGPSRRVAIVHNGIVENHLALRSVLVAGGVTFTSETDTELIAALIDRELADDADLPEAVSAAFAQVEGCNAVVAIDRERQMLVATKRVSPLVVGISTGGTLIASDALALRPYCDEVLFLEDEHLAVLDDAGLHLLDRQTLTPVDAARTTLPALEEEPDLGRFPHFMAKEMAEQPAAIERLVLSSTTQLDAMADSLATAEEIILIGCGTAGHAALSGKYLFSQVAGRPVEVIAASEFRYHRHHIDGRTMVVALSQSGETVDVIEAMRSAREAGARLGAIVNVQHSTLDRMVDDRVHLRAGPEQCVLATKSYTAMVTALVLLAHRAAGRHAQGEEEALRAAKLLRPALDPTRTRAMRETAEIVARAEHLFVIGRGPNYPTALEAALKIKEVSYVHAEGFAAGELKHGVIALIEPGTPCLVFAPHDETRAEVLSAAMELRSRGGFMIGVGPEPDPVFDIHIPMTDCGHATPVVHALAAQMIGYHAALIRGNDPDRPRNLAKSVTVK